MTGETEAQLLVGSFQPSHGGNQIEWDDGVVTQAIQEGKWALLDNFGDADPCVLERLNPCLEHPVDWRLVEKGDDTPLDVSRGSNGERFRFIATMTAEVNGSGDKDLSPALYNRFNIVHMEGVHELSAGDKLASAQRAALLEELTQIVKTLLGDACTVADLEASGESLLSPRLDEQKSEGGPNMQTASTASRVASVCLQLWEQRDRPPEGLMLAQPLTFRTLIRLIDSAYRLWSTRRLTIGRALKEAFSATLAGLYQEVSGGGVDEVASTTVAWQAQEMFDAIVDGLVPDDDGAEAAADGSTKGAAERTLERLMAGASEEMIITRSREPYAKQALLAVECSLPVLLEGPAAVGKTALIAALSKLYEQEISTVGKDKVASAASSAFPAPAGTGRLLRVNNTATTTIQDYLGAFLPSGDAGALE